MSQKPYPFPTVQPPVYATTQAPAYSVTGIGSADSTGGSPPLDAGVYRTTVGLLAAAGTTASPHSTANWTEGTNTALSVVSGRLRNTVTNTAGSYEPVTLNASPIRGRRWIQGEVGRFFATAAWVGLGVGNAADRDFLGLATKINENTNGQRMASVNAGAFTTLSQRTDAHSASVLYMQAVRCAGTSNGITVLAYDYNDTAQMGPHTNTVASSAARVAFMTEDNFAGDLGRVWDMSDWLVTVSGVPAGSRAKIVNASTATLVSAASTGGDIVLSLHSSGSAPIRVTNMAALIVTDASSNELQRFTPSSTDSANIGIFGGDAYTYVP